MTNTKFCVYVNDASVVYKFGQHSGDLVALSEAQMKATRLGVTRIRKLVVPLFDTRVPEDARSVSLSRKSGITLLDLHGALQRLLAKPVTQEMWTRLKRAYIDKKPLMWTPALRSVPPRKPKDLAAVLVNQAVIGVRQVRGREGVWELDMAS